MAKTKKDNKKAIIETYMQHILEHGVIGIRVYDLCKELKMKEADFYKEFASVRSVRDHIFHNFFEHTIKLLSKSKEYEEFDARNKMLSFYFTFFEMLTANRSFVLAELKRYHEPL